MPSVQFIIGGTLKFLVEEEEVYAVVTLYYRNFTITARGANMAYTLPVDYGVKVQVAYVDGHGNPAMVDGPVQWASSDTTIAEVIADTSDSQNAMVQAKGVVGQVQISVTADADLGVGVRNFVTLMDVRVIAGEGVSRTMTPVGDAIPPSPAE